MDYEHFIERVHARAHLQPKEAVNATCATLKTLAEQIGPAPTRRLAAQLPRELACYLQVAPADEMGHFSFGEFCQRVAIREDSNVPDAIAHARCVIETLEEALDRSRCGTVFVELREELAPLFG